MKLLIIKKRKKENDYFFILFKCCQLGLNSMSSNISAPQGAFLVTFMIRAINEFQVLTFVGENSMMTHEEVGTLI